MGASSGYYAPALALWAGLIMKLPGLYRTWRDPLIRSVCLVIGLGGAGLVLAAPDTIAAVNRATGVPNLAAPLVYAVVSAHSASCLLLIIHWRGGPERSVHRLARRWGTCYAVVIALLITLFALGDAPVERRTDLDTYYATAPWVGQMIVLYLLGHMTAAVATTALCWRWAREVHGWLRAGLWLLVGGWLLNLSFSGLKLAAVAARWTGRDWDVLSTTLAPRLVGLGATVAALGFTVPVLGPWLAETVRSVRIWWQLGPLWRELSNALPPGSLSTPIPWHSPPRIRLTRREAGIHGGLNLLAPYLDPTVRDTARDTARTAGARSDEATLTGLAAMIATAARTARQGPTATPGPLRAPAELPTGRPALLGIARALRTSPIVAAVRTTAPATPATHDERTPL